MKLKYSIIACLLTGVFGFIKPIIKNNQISYTIYASTINEANKAKEELISFYKEFCYSSLFDEINAKIVDNIDNLSLNCSYSNYHFDILTTSDKIKMTGYLYLNTQSKFNYRYYFTSSTYSIPLATSSKVATLALSDQI